MRKKGNVLGHGPLTRKNEEIQISFTHYLLVSRSFQLKMSINQLSTNNFIVVNKGFQEVLHFS